MSNQVSFRVFGSTDCDHCKTLIKKLSDSNLPYQFIDANAEENTDLCDSQNVMELPHIQAIFEGNKFAFEASGEVATSNDFVDIFRRLNDIVAISQKREKHNEQAQ